jgi:hypothetical protein
MSDLNDLIHTNAHNAFAIGVKTERDRIIKLIENNTDVDVISNRMVFTSRNWVTPERLIQLIKGKQT